MQSRDVTGSAQNIGGASVFVKIEEKCLVTDNFRCDRVPNLPDVLNGTSYQVMADLNNGRYSAPINVVRTSETTMSVLLAKKGGFYGEYFNNAFLQGVPAMTRIDHYLDFDWGTGLITKEAADFVSVQWFGRIKPPYNETFVFLVSADDGLRITIDGKLMVDRWDSCCDEV